MTASDKFSLVIYTTDKQTEQPYVVKDVTTFDVDGGFLGINCASVGGHGAISARHLYLPSEWHHFEVHHA